MRDPLEVLRLKEAELQRLQEEVEALRRVGRMLRENSPSYASEHPVGKVIQMPQGPVNLA
jgi:hypothetical protein